MPGYRFHVISAQVDADDLEDHELPSLDAARTRAIDGIRALLGHEVMRGILDLRGRIDIAEPTGAVLATIPFAAAVTIISGHDRQ